MSDATQERMRDARTQDWYDHIWKTVGKCVFCDLRDKYILYEENGIVLTINLYPYIDGQMMVVPRRHVSSPKQLTELEWETMREFAYIGKKLIRKVHGHKGMWSLIREGGEPAQMTVTDHLHMQLIPFDQPDLCKWNFRELQNTPLQNVAVYKKAAKTLVENKQKFVQKYRPGQMLPVVCDLVIVDTDGRVLLQERAEGYKLDPDYLTLPGGHVDDARAGLLPQLAKEIKEELGYDLDTSKVELIGSQVSSVNFAAKAFGDVDFSRSQMFVWNTYLLKDFADGDKLTVGSDAAQNIWLRRRDLKKYKNRMSAELYELISHII